MEHVVYKDDILYCIFNFLNWPAPDRAVRLVGVTTSLLAILSPEIWTMKSKTAAICTQTCRSNLLPGYNQVLRKRVLFKISIVLAVYEEDGSWEGDFVISFEVSLTAWSRAHTWV
jgi:hypothetical protein